MFYWKYFVYKIIQKKQFCYFFFVFPIGVLWLYKKFCFEIFSFFFFADQQLSFHEYPDKVRCTRSWNSTHQNIKNSQCILYSVQNHTFLKSGMNSSFNTSILLTPFPRKRCTNCSTYFFNIFLNIVSPNGLPIFRKKNL